VEDIQQEEDNILEVGIQDTLLVEEHHLEQEDIQLEEDIQLVEDIQ